MAAMPISAALPIAAAIVDFRGTVTGTMRTVERAAGLPDSAWCSLSGDG